MHASCESPWHSLAKRARLGGLLPPQVAFQEHAAHPPRWPGELSSKGSSDTCISDGVSTFLYRAFTAHGPHLVRVHARFTLASLAAGLNAHSCFDDPRQFHQRRLLRAGRCWGGNCKTLVAWPVLYICYSNPEKPPYARQTATRGSVPITGDGIQHTKNA